MITQETKTYREMMQENPNLITAPIDDALKGTIADWFNLRHVCDDDNFPIFFNRVLNRDYARYKQLIRIQPGYAEYDWAVGNYMERQTTNTADSKQSTTASGTNATSGSTTGKQTNSGTDTTANTGTVNTRTGVKRDETGSTTETATGKETNSGTDTVTATGSATNTKDLSNKTVYAGSEANTRTGSETNSATHNLGAVDTTQKTQNNQTRATDTTGSPQTVTAQRASNATATKQAPMDAGVAATGTDTQHSFTYKTLSVNFDGHATAISQQQNDNIESATQTLDTHTTESYTGTADTVTTNTGAIENTDAETKTYNSVKDTKQFTGRTDTTTETGTDKNETNSTQATEHGAILDTTNSKTGTSTANIGETTDSTRKDDTLQTITHGAILETEGTNSATQKTDNKTDTTGSNNSVTRERLSGRTEPPGDIMLRAITFIERSNAWEWLMPRLETCFISIYEI